MIFMAKSGPSMQFVYKVFAHYKFQIKFAKVQLKCKTVQKG